MSHTTPAAGSGPQNIVSIDWKLLVRRLSAHTGQMFTSVRYHARNTDYTPPTWLSRMRLTWFRLGLIAIVVFVFTQKQVDLTLSMGANGIDVENGESASDQATSTNAALSIVPGSSITTATVAAPVWNVDQLDVTAVRNYIERFERVALTEESKFGIPATAKLAMAIYESQGGRAAAARNDNNHFPLASGGKHYDNAWASWRGHSEDLTRRFPELAGSTDDYRKWIATLDKTGYSRSPDYGKNLLRIIDRFGLAN